MGSMSIGHAATGPLAAGHNVCCIAGVTEPYWERFKRLKAEKRLSWSDLVRASEKASLSTLRAFALAPAKTADGKRSRDRYPSADTIADVARALNVPPEEFPEYRLAKAREALDERIAGLEEALENLEAREPTRLELDDASLEQFRSRAKARAPLPDEDRRQSRADRRSSDAQGGRP